jgi:hypothetical protein
MVFSEPAVPQNLTDVSRWCQAMCQVAPVAANWDQRLCSKQDGARSRRRPSRRAASVRIPLLLVVPEADSIAPGVELFRSAGGHYDVCECGASFAEVLSGFLKALIAERWVRVTIAHWTVEMGKTDPMT